MIPANVLLSLSDTANPLAHLLRGEHSWAILFGIALLGISLFAWSVIVSKSLALKRSNKNDEIFLNHFRDSAHPLEAYGANARPDGSVLHQVYTLAARELTYHWLGSSTVDDTFEPRLRRASSMSKCETTLFQTRLRRIAEESRQNLFSRMPLLGGMVSTVPLLGILATAWSLMIAVGNHSAAGSLAESGIGTSLSLTVLALLVAVPVGLGAKFLREKLQSKSRQVRLFCEELDSSIIGAYHNVSDDKTTTREQARPKKQRKTTTAAPTAPTPAPPAEPVAKEAAPAPPAAQPSATASESKTLTPVRMSAPTTAVPAGTRRDRSGDTAAPAPAALKAQAAVADVPVPFATSEASPDLTGQQLTFDSTVVNDPEFTDEPNINPVARQTALQAPGLLQETAP